jgi:hypothetical protein
MYLIQCSDDAFTVYSSTLRLAIISYLHTSTLSIKMKVLCVFIPVNSSVWLLIPTDNGN